MESPQSPPKEKKARLEDTTSVCWEHYRNFLDSNGQDTDELDQILTILVPDDESNTIHLDKANKSFQIKLNASTDVSIIQILVSMVYCHLANEAISKRMAMSGSPLNNHDHPNDDNDNKHEDSYILSHLMSSLRYFPQNPATLSMGANYARIYQRMNTSSICSFYQQAAGMAQDLRNQVLEMMDDESIDTSVKEWLELLVLDGVLGVEYLTADQTTADETDASQQEENQNEDDSGYFGPSAVEATCRFMSSMLLSTMGNHEEAKQDIQRFDLTHRLHPNVWRHNTTNTSNSSLLSSTDGSSNNDGPRFYTDNVLPKELYQKMCQLFAPDAAYWKESDYINRDYYSYFFNISPDMTPQNLIEEVVVHHLLPLAQATHNTNTDEIIVGAEWWAHTRPIQANLGHNLHFDTDEALLAKEGTISHPVLSSVLYLTTGGNIKSDSSATVAGSTIILDQTPDSQQVAKRCWVCRPQDNSFMLFDGKLLHGVLPCPGSGDNGEVHKEFGWDVNEGFAEPNHNKNNHRLTFMVGFWTRHVPEKMNDRKLYGPCEPLPPVESAEWVKDIQSFPECAPTQQHEQRRKTPDLRSSQLPSISPAWEDLTPTHEEEGDKDDEMLLLELPRAIDHRFFVKNAPQCFRESLFQQDECEEEEEEA